MKKVLILEDEVNIRSFVVINLKRAGYEAIEAATGQEALDKRLTGEGEGFLISSGQYEKITWKKNENQATELFDQSGNKIPMSVGNTWWHIISPSFNITINGE